VTTPGSWLVAGSSTRRQSTTFTVAQSETSGRLVGSTSTLAAPRLHLAFAKALERAAAAQRAGSITAGRDARQRRAGDAERVAATAAVVGRNATRHAAARKSWVRMSGMARNLILNVDDIGIHNGAVEVAVEAITDGLAASGSVMAVCEGTAAALALLADRPAVPVGVHLTLTRDLPEWKWAPLTPGPSIQDGGLFLPIDHRKRLLAQATASDIAAEFRAQIEVVLKAGVQPTHLDWHCLADGGREDIFDLTLALANEYHLGIRAWTEHGREQLQASGRTAQDHPFLDSFALPISGKEDHLLEQIRHLPVGLSEWAVHPAAANPADPGSRVRVSDHRALMSSELRRAIQDEGITVLGYHSPTMRPAR
jgi:chitin disaccharide deacetylase